MNRHKHRLPDRCEEIEEYQITLGSGGKGYLHYKALRQLCLKVIKNERDRLNYADAHLLQHWYDNASKSKRAGSPFTLYIDPYEWHALSRGLRALGTPHANSTYQYCNRKKWEVAREQGV